LLPACAAVRDSKGIIAAIMLRCILTAIIIANKKVGRETLSIRMS